MWNLVKNVHTRKAALVQGYAEERIEEKEAKHSRKFSGNMAMVIGFFITVEIMIGGAMIFNYDFHGADVIALLFAFMVLYSGVVAILTDK